MVQCWCMRLGGGVMRLFFMPQQYGMMARMLKWSLFGLAMGLSLPTLAIAQDAPKLRTLEGRKPVIAGVQDSNLAAEQAPQAEKAAVNLAKPVSVTGVKLPDPPKADKADKKAFAAKMQDIFKLKALRNTTIGVHIVDLDTGDEVYAHNADKLMKPASNTKLLTTAAALEILGPDHQFETQLLADGKIEKGVLKGDLYLHIDHDFTWSNRFYNAGDVPLRGLISQLKDAGIQKIQGKVVVSGHVIYGGTATGTLSTAAHLNTAGNRFRTLLRQSKIGMGSFAIRQTAKPKGKTIGTWHSPVLAEAIVPLNRVSHNEYADMLLLAIGHKVHGKNTYEAGAKAVKAWLKDAGLPTKGIELHDGSGLSHNNRMSPTFFTTLVKYMLKSKAGREWAASMSISGYDGTYGGRLMTDDTKGRVYAKSGTLRDTITGSGFFFNKYDGHTYAFSLLVNNMRNKKLTRQAIDRMLRVFSGDHLGVKLPAQPLMSSLRKEDDGRIIARWDNVKNVQGYRVYQSHDGARWEIAGETAETHFTLTGESVHVRVTAVSVDGAESMPSMIYSYRPGNKTMTIVEQARCRSDEMMRPANHLFAHERPIAQFIDESWGIETVRNAKTYVKDGLFYHSVTCKGAIAWNEADFKAAAKADIPVIVNVVDAHLSADASGTCDPISGKVLGCFGEPVITKDRRMGKRQENYRLRKAAGTGSSRPSQIKTWNGGKKVLEMNDMPVAVQSVTDKKGSMTVMGVDVQALDSLKTLKALWKEIDK